jgi:hypothetical protein
MTEFLNPTPVGFANSRGGFVFVDESAEAQRADLQAKPIYAPHRLERRLAARSTARASGGRRTAYATSKPEAPIESRSGSKNQPEMMIPSMIVQ